MVCMSVQHYNAAEQECTKCTKYNCCDRKQAVAKGSWPH